MKKSNNMTELVFVLDRSGSMADLADDTIGGFNAMLQKQKGEPGRAFVTTVLFDTHVQRLHDRLPLERVPQMSGQDYLPGGCTALLDAVGETIEHISSIHRYARKEDVPARTVFVIMTDGMENASRRYSARKIREMIRYKQEKRGWDFLFLGANIDAVSEAAGMGIESARAANYHADAQGMERSFDAMNRAICHARCAAPLGADWKQDLDADFEERK